MEHKQERPFLLIYKVWHAIQAVLAAIVGQLVYSHESHTNVILAIAIGTYVVAAVFIFKVLYNFFGGLLDAFLPVKTDSPGFIWTIGCAYGSLITFSTIHIDFVRHSFGVQYMPNMVAVSVLALCVARFRLRPRTYEDPEKEL